MLVCFLVSSLSGRSKCQALLLSSSRAFLSLLNSSLFNNLVLSQGRSLRRPAPLSSQDCNGSVTTEPSLKSFEMKFAPSTKRFGKATSTSSTDFERALRFEVRYPSCPCRISSRTPSSKPSRANFSRKYCTRLCPTWGGGRVIGGRAPGGGTGPRLWGDAVESVSTSQSGRATRVVRATRGRPGPAPPSLAAPWRGAWR